MKKALIVTFIALFMLLPIMMPTSEGITTLKDGENLFSELGIDTIRLSASNGGEAKDTIRIPFSVDSIEDRAFSLSLHIDFSGKAPASDFDIEVYCNNRFHKSKSVNSTRLENVGEYRVDVIIPFDTLLEGNNVIELRLTFISSYDGTTTLILNKDSYLFVKTISYIQSEGEYSFSELGGALPYPSTFQDYLPDGSPKSQTVVATLEFKISEYVMTDQVSTNLRAYYSVENYPTVYNMSISLFWNQKKLSTWDRNINNKSETMEFSTIVNKTLLYEGRNTLNIEFSIFGNVSQYAIGVLSNSTVQISPFRDVKVASLSVTPRVIEPGDWIVINTTVENLGSKDELVNIRLEIDSKRITTTKIKLLEGELIRKQFLWKAKSGRHKIAVFAEIDGFSHQKEIISGNNNLTLTLHIPTQDVTLSHVVISPAHPKVSGEVIRVNAYIENIGAVNETVTINLYIDNILVNTTKASVPVSSSVEVTLEWIATEGNHSILVKISGIKNEENTADNSYSTTILVLESLFSISLYGETLLFDLIDIQFLYGALLILLTHIIYFSYYLRRISFVEKHHRDILFVIIGLTFPLLLFQAYNIRRTFEIPLLFEGLIIGNLLLCNILFIFGKRKWTTGSILGDKTTKELLEYLKRKLGI
ncbi:MAG: hypothetical protein ACFFCD_12305 [Promethearchaeota archaeon]